MSKLREVLERLPKVAAGVQQGQWIVAPYATNQAGESDCGIAAFVDLGDGLGNAVSVARCPRHIKRKQWEANAALMALAPDMAKALEGARALLERATEFSTLIDHEHVEDYQCILCEALNAISEALGR